jgi:hypothetical protein
MRACLCAVVVTGCFYRPGSYSGIGTPFKGQRLAVGCLDLTVALTTDAYVHYPIVEYSFGNRCLHAVTVDLAAVHAFTVGGAEVPMLDPRHEIRPGRLDGLWMGDERIAYVSPTEALCLDVGPITHAPSQWVCLGGAVRAADGAILEGADPS